MFDVFVLLFLDGGGTKSYFSAPGFPMEITCRLVEFYIMLLCVN